MLVSTGNRGRNEGSTNEWVFFTLLYRVRHNIYPDGISERMCVYYDEHPKLVDAKRVVRLERKGEHVEYANYFKNTKERTVKKVETIKVTDKENDKAAGTTDNGVKYQRGRPRSNRTGRVVDIGTRRNASERRIQPLSLQ